MADLSFKYTKKAVRDIILSNDIGRESPFDPFKDRTVTKFMTKPDVFVSDRMYFAERPQRKVPCMVDYNKVPHQPVSVSKMMEADEGGMPSSTRPEDEALMQRGYVRPEGVKDVSFTKSERFDAKKPRNHVQLRKDLMDERETNVKREKYGASEAVELVRKPDCSKAPTFGVPKPKEEYSLLKKGQTKFTSFDFEQKKPATNGGEKDASRRLVSPTSQGSFGTTNPYRVDDGAPIGGEGVDVDDEGALDEIRASANTTAQARAAMANASDAQEAWEAKRKETLSKHGLITGNRKELLKARAIAKRSETVRGIADFSVLASREAPMGYQPNDKEMHDLLYAPTYVATTRELKRYADVRIGKYAARSTNTTVLKDNVDKLLTIENLSRFYKQQLEKDKRSVFVTPDQANEGAEDASFLSYTHTSAGSNGGKNNASPMGKDAQAFSPFDDFALHPPTPPKGAMTRKFTKTPDLTVYADRNGEPLSAILGGDLQKRERQARQALRREGLL